MSGNIDRKRGPEIKQIKSLDIPNIEKEILSNGTVLHFINMGTQNLVQLEVLFKGGRIDELKAGVSSATGRLIKEGTTSRSGSQIAEDIDYLGANLSTGASLDYSYLKIFALKKHFHDVFLILQDMLTSPSFPEQELEKYISSSLHKLQIEKAKSELVAYKTITEILYGEHHPYGYNSAENTYKNLTRSDLIHHFEHAYGSENMNVIISGKLDDHIKNDVTSFFNSFTKSASSNKIEFDPLTKNRVIKRIPSNDEIQSAIKIGCRMFDRRHPDFNDMFITNTILGGYFGSRLMSSLREKKGYTYNIYSSIDMMIYDGYFNVSTEVGNEYLAATIRGIYEEMDKLSNETIGDYEMQMVRNYLSGNFLNMIDGPFKVAGMTKVIALNDLTYDFYKKLMKRVHTITPAEIQATAQKYLQKENMVEVIVGN